MQLGRKKTWVLRGDSGTKHPVLDVWSHQSQLERMLWLRLCICCYCLCYLTCKYPHSIPSSPMKKQYITVRRKELLSSALDVPLLIYYFTMSSQSQIPVLDTHNGFRRPSGWLSREYTVYLTSHISECFGDLNLENLPKIAIEGCQNVESCFLIS